MGRAFTNASTIRQTRQGSSNLDGKNYAKLHEDRNMAIENGNTQQALQHNLAIRNLEHEYKIPEKSRTAKKNIFGTQTYYDTETGKMIKLGGKRRTRKKRKKRRKKRRTHKRSTHKRRKKRRTHKRRTYKKNFKDC